MKEPYSKDLASHAGPESCGCVRKGVSEALTGGNAGRVLSLENAYMGAPTPWTYRKATSQMRAKASASRAPRGQRPRACADTPYTGTGRPYPRLLVGWPQAAKGTPRRQSFDERE